MAIPESEKVKVATKNPIDSWLDAEDAEATRIAEGQNVTNDVPLEAPAAKTPPPAETPPAKVEEPPAAETPPAAAKSAEPVAPATDEPPDPDAPPTGKFPWKDYRTGQREIKETRAQLIETQRRLDELAAQIAIRKETVAETPPVEEPIDPFQSIEARQARLEAEQANLRQREQQLIQTNQIRAEEEIYRREKPDYDQAVNYLIESIRKEEGPVAMNIMAPRMLADPQAAAGIRQLRASPTEMAQYGLRGDMTDREIANEIAIRSIIEARRQQGIQVARMTGQSVPAFFYGVATDTRGYRPAAATPPVVTALATPPITPQQRVQREKEKSEIAHSVSGVQGGTAAPAEQIRTRRELAAFMKSDPAGYDRWQAHQDVANPHWLEELPE